MTEVEWLVGANPTQMLGFLRGKVSDRKLRLFVCACCDRIGHLFAADRDRKTLNVIERFADGRATWSELMTVSSRMMDLAILGHTNEEMVGGAVVASTLCADAVAGEHG